MATSVFLRHPVTILVTDFTCADSLYNDLLISNSLIINAYSGDLKCTPVWISNGQKEVGLQMVQISNEICNPEAQLFRIWTNDRHLFKNM